jgi:putative transposase
MTEHESVRRNRLVDRITRLSDHQLREVEGLVDRLELHGTLSHTFGRGSPEKESDDKSSHSKDWPHAPIHRLAGKGTYIVTAGTLNKERLFRDTPALDMLESELLRKAKEYHWQIEAWAVFSNHYHFVAHALRDARTLRPMLTHLHADTARTLNRWQSELERQVWYNFWETELTYEKSYLARLNYVHQNAVRHRLAPVANQYRWCSAAWFERTATPAQVKTIYSLKTDRITIVDDFDVLGV